MIDLRREDGGEFVLRITDPKTGRPAKVYSSDHEATARQYELIARLAYASGRKDEAAARAAMLRSLTGDVPTTGVVA